MKIPVFVARCLFCVVAGILQDNVQRRKQDGVGIWPKCFRFVLFLPAGNKVKRRKTKYVHICQIQDCEAAMEIDTEDQGDSSLARNLLPRENKQICSLLVRIEDELSQITEKPHRQEDREIVSSLLQVRLHNL